MNQYMNKVIFTHKEQLLRYMIIASLEILEKMNMPNRLLEKPWLYHIDWSVPLAIGEILDQ